MLWFAAFWRTRRWDSDQDRLLRSWWRINLPCFPPSLYQKRHGLNRENDNEEADSGGQCQVNNKGGVSPISSGHRWAGA
jgi:hypothetical protein